MVTSDQIREVQQARGLSLGDISKVSGIGKSSLHNWLKKHGFVIPEKYQAGAEKFLASANAPLAEDVERANGFDHGTEAPIPHGDEEPVEIIGRAVDLDVEITAPEGGDIEDEDDLSDEIESDEAETDEALQRGALASADVETVNALIERARGVKALADIGDIISDAGRAFVSEVQIEAVISTIMAALPRGSITKDALRRDIRNHRAEAVREYEATASGSDAEDNANQTQLLAQLLREKGVTFHVDGRNDAPVVKLGDNLILPIDDPAFTADIYEWWEAEFGQDKVPTKQAIDDNMRRVRARAGKQPASFSTSIRYHVDPIYTADGAYSGVRSLFIDLGGPSRTALRVTPDAIAVLSAAEVEDHEVRFLHRPTHTPMVVYDPNATPDDAIEEIEALCRFEAPGGARVLFGTLCAQMLVGEGTKAILVFSGPGGTGKTTAALLSASVLDGATTLDGDAKDAEDFLIVAQNQSLVTFDNITTISTALANVLCRIVQPAAKNKRRGYFTQKAVSFSAHATVIGTSTSDGGTIEREDLLDRVELYRMRSAPSGEGEDQRMTEQATLAAIRRAAPIVLGGVLRAIQQLLPHLDFTKTVSADRLASVANVLDALDKARVAKGGFLDAFTDMRAEGARDFAMLDSVGRCLASLALKHGSKTASGGVHWTEQVAKAHSMAQSWADDHKANKEKGWPQHADAFYKAVSRLTATATKGGMAVERTRAGKLRTRMLDVTLTAATAAAAREAALDAGHMFDDTEAEPDKAVAHFVEQIEAWGNDSATPTALAMMIEAMKEALEITDYRRAKADHHQALLGLVQAGEIIVANSPPETF